MLIYSQKTVRLIKHIQASIKEILIEEVKIPVDRTRFTDPKTFSSYPIKVVIFNHKKMWGYFDPTFYEMGFHESLLHVSQEELKCIIRHEIAHYFTFIRHGHEEFPHGTAFRTFCQSMGWGEEVSKASFCLEEHSEPLFVEKEEILRKVQKLMALSQSTNPHEAENAMIKSQQLLLKHHLDAKDLVEEDEAMVLKRILMQKKKTAKMRAIAVILQSFFVSCVYNYTNNSSVCLEVLGEKVNVEIAEYVAKVLETELENLWHRAQREIGLKGMVAKNSFILGIAKGYCDKIQALKRDYNRPTLRAVMEMDHKLQKAQETVYGRLSKGTSYAQHCPQSAKAGERMGRNLQIQTPIHRHNKEPKQIGV